MRAKHTLKIWRLQFNKYVAAISPVDKQRCSRRCLITQSQEYNVLIGYSNLKDLRCNDKSFGYFFPSGDYQV